MDKKTLKFRLLMSPFIVIVIVVLEVYCGKALEFALYFFMLCLIVTFMWYLLESIIKDMLKDREDEW